MFFLFIMFFLFCLFIAWVGYVVAQIVICLIFEGINYLVELIKNRRRK
jgi:hypothetical protein